MPGKVRFQHWYHQTLHPPREVTHQHHSNFTKNCACHRKLHSNSTSTLPSIAPATKRDNATSPNNSAPATKSDIPTLYLHQVMQIAHWETVQLQQMVRVPRKVTMQFDQIVHLSRQVTFEYQSNFTKYCPCYAKRRRNFNESSFSLTLLFIESNYCSLTLEFFDSTFAWF